MTGLKTLFINLILLALFLGLLLIGPIVKIEHSVVNQCSISQVNVEYKPCSHDDQMIMCYYKYMTISSPGFIPQPVLFGTYSNSYIMNKAYTNTVTCYGDDRYPGSLALQPWYKGQPLLIVTYVIVLIMPILLMIAVTRHYRKTYPTIIIGYLPL